MEYFQVLPTKAYGVAKIMSSQPEFLRDTTTGLSTTRFRQAWDSVVRNLPWSSCDMRCGSRRGAFEPGSAAPPPCCPHPIPAPTPAPVCRLERMRPWQGAVMMGVSLACDTRHTPWCDPATLSSDAVGSKTSAAAAKLSLP